MFRVESVEQGSRTIVSIAGRLEGNHLQLVESQCATATGDVTLDLSELRSADEDAIRWLLTWVASGESIAGESPYIRLLLNRDLENSDQ